MRVYILAYSCLSFGLGFALWYAWARAHMLYMLSSWIHSWVLSWVPLALMVFGLAGIVASVQVYRDNSQPLKSLMQAGRWQILAPFIAAGLILGAIALAAMVVWIVESTSIT